MLTDEEKRSSTLQGIGLGIMFGLIVFADAIAVWIS